MSVDILRELADSRSFDLNAKDGSATFHYFAHSTTVGATTENDIYVAVLADLTLAPYVWNNLQRGRPSAKAMGNGWFDVTLPYTRPEGATTSDPGAVTPPGGQPPSPPPGQPKPEDQIDNGVSIEIGGKPPRLFKSRKTIIRTSPNGLPPDFQGLINVGQDGKADGVELPDPTFTLSVTRTFDYLTWGYLDRLEETCWKRNDKPFAARPAGHLLLTGVSGKIEKNGKCPLTFRFGIDKGEDVPVEGLDPQHRGPWEYIWFAYADGKNAADTRLGLKIIGVYVEELVAEADYSKLGLG